jgi:hypothetical protein
MKWDPRPITQQQRDRMAQIFKESQLTFQDLVGAAINGASDSLRFGVDHMEDLTRGDLERIILAYDRKLSQDS